MKSKKQGSWKKDSWVEYGAFRKFVGSTSPLRVRKKIAVRREDYDFLKKKHGRGLNTTLEDFWYVMQGDKASWLRKRGETTFTAERAMKIAYILWDSGCRLDGTEPGDELFRRLVGHE